MTEETPTLARTRRPTIGFVGIHAGRHKGRPVSQNETLASLFSSVGYRVRRCSSIINPPLRTAHQIISLLTWRKVDVVVVAVFSGRSFLMADFSSLISRLMGKRIVMFLHGGRLPEFGPAHRRWVDRVFQRADLLLAPSDFLADAFRPWGFDIRVIPNVLAIERYRYEVRTSARPRLLWMRTFHEHYDPLTAVRVLARVAEQVPDVTMTMGGADQGLLDATVAEAERLGVSDRIEFAGYLDHDGKLAAFADHDIFLNTNVVDNMPVSLLEASASGLVPVATAVGGIPAMLTDGDNGRLVPAGDVEAMSRAVLDLLADDDEYARMAASARRSAELSAWPEVRKHWTRELSLVLPDLDIP